MNAILITNLNRPNDSNDKVSCGSHCGMRGKEKYYNTIAFFLTIFTTSQVISVGIVAIHDQKNWYCLLRILDKYIFEPFQKIVPGPCNYFAQYCNGVDGANGQHISKIISLVVKPDH